MLLGLPDYSFRPSDYPASAFANAIAEGRSQVVGNLPADSIDFSATGPDQLAWAMMAGPVERVYGTIEK